MVTFILDMRNGLFLKSHSYRYFTTTIMLLKIQKLTLQMMTQFDPMLLWMLLLILKIKLRNHPMLTPKKMPDGFNNAQRWMT